MGEAVDGRGETPVEILGGSLNISLYDFPGSSSLRTIHVTGVVYAGAIPPFEAKSFALLSASARASSLFKGSDCSNIEGRSVGNTSFLFPKKALGLDARGGARALAVVRGLAVAAGGPVG